MADVTVVVQGGVCADSRCWFCGRPHFVSVLNTGQGSPWISSWPMCRRCALASRPIGGNDAFPGCLPFEKVSA